MTISKTTVVLLISALVAAAVGGYGLWWISRPAVDTTVAVIAKPAPAIKKVKKKVIPVKQVTVYAPEAKAKLKLPASVIASTDQHVTGAATVRPTERPVTITSVLDTKTGETATFTKVEPYPWLAVESRGEVRFDVGYKMTRAAPVPLPVGRLSLTHNFIQVKALHAGVNVALDTDGQAFAGVGLSYRW